MKRELTILDSNAEQSQADYSAFQNIITENLQFIEKQCFKAVKTKLRNDSS
ncbi:MAG: hypothetical protein GY757_42040, partial [bacterium]|nr:hypothetical protein [bacterium]